MNKIGVVSALLAILLSSTGCDMFRRMAGRPTSDDIAQKKAMIDRIMAKEQENASIQQALADSIVSLTYSGVEEEDTLAVADSISNLGIKLSGSPFLEEKSKDALAMRYYIVVGTFSKLENAKILVAKAKAGGLESELIPYANGLTAVGVCPTNSLSEALDSVIAVRNYPFCPKDAWILDKLK